MKSRQRTFLFLLRLLATLFGIGGGAYLASLPFFPQTPAFQAILSNHGYVTLFFMFMLTVVASGAVGAAFLIWRRITSLSIRAVCFVTFCVASIGLLSAIKTDSSGKKAIGIAVVFACFWLYYTGTPRLIRYILSENGQHSGPNQ